MTDIIHKHLEPMSDERMREREEAMLEYREFCAEEPNAARRLDICLRGHDIPWTLVTPIHDLLEQLADVIDAHLTEKGGE